MDKKSVLNQLMGMRMNSAMNRITELSPSLPNKRAMHSASEKCMAAL